MTLLAALLVAQAPTSVADFFPLVPGVRRTYEEKSDDGTITLIDEVGKSSPVFGKEPSTPIVQKSQFNQIISTQYFQVVGSGVYMVGRAETRTEAPVTGADGAIDVGKPRKKKTVLEALTPRMPVFKYDGKETTWTFGEVPYFQAEGEDPIKTDETAIKGVAKPGPARTVLGRRVETIEVHTDVQYGSGKIGQKFTETSIYGRGIGLIEAIQKSVGAGQKVKETRTKLIAIEETKDGL